MIIAFDATPLQTGHRTRGVGTYTRSLLSALLAHDHTNQYLLIVHGNEGLPAVPPNARLVNLPRPRLGRFTGVVTHQLFLPVVLARLRADLFHSPGFVAAFSVPGIPWRCPLPMVLTLHDFIPVHVPALSLNKPVNRWWYARQCAWAAQATRLLCVSHATLHDAVAFLKVPPARCTVVHEGVDASHYYPAETPSTATPYVLFVGGNYPNKNRAAALAAFARLTQSTDLPHRLVLVGPDDRSDADLLARAPGLDLTRVERIRWASAAELAGLYRHAALFIFPSTYEGFGLPILEAMASGIPVIAGNTSSLPEVAGNAALLVDPHDDRALADAIIRVLTSPDLRARLRTAGLARARTFTWQAAAEGTLEVYRAALS